MMIRTQIYFDKDLYTLLKINANYLNISLSECIRQNIKENITKKKNNKYTLYDFAKSAKALSKETTNLAQEMDKYLPEEFQ